MSFIAPLTEVSCATKSEFLSVSVKSIFPRKGSHGAASHCTGKYRFWRSLFDHRKPREPTDRSGVKVTGYVPGHQGEEVFMYMAEKHGHSWVPDLNLSKTNTEKGERMIIPNRKYDKKYRITVPQDKWEETLDEINGVNVVTGKQGLNEMSRAAALWEKSW